MTLSMRTSTPVPVEKSESFGNYLIHGIDEIVLPEPIAWWPTAPGWQALGLMVLVLLIVVAVRGLRLWWRNRYRREALRQLSLLRRRPNNRLQDVVAALPYYLKATALHAYSRNEVASLSGPAWLMFLDAHYSGPSFATGVGQKLLSVAYRPRDKWQLDEQESLVLINMARQWIAEHQGATYV
jgi:hypothetical protein